MRDGAARPRQRAAPRADSALQGPTVSCPGAVTPPPAVGPAVLGAVALPAPPAAVGRRGPARPGGAPHTPQCRSLPPCLAGGGSGEDHFSAAAENPPRPPSAARPLPPAFPVRCGPSSGAGPVPFAAAGGAHKGGGGERSRGEAAGGGGGCRGLWREGGEGGGGRGALLPGAELAGVGCGRQRVPRAWASRWSRRGSAAPAVSLAGILALGSDSEQRSCCVRLGLAGLCARGERGRGNLMLSWFIFRAGHPALGSCGGVGLGSLPVPRCVSLWSPVPLSALLCFSR